VNRPVVGILVAVSAARFGPWDQDVAMAPASMTAAVHELGWMALLLAPDDALATEPGEVLQLLDGLIVPDWGADLDRGADFSRALAESAQARGLPVLRLPASALGPDRTVADYVRAIGDLFTPETRVASGWADRATDRDAEPSPGRSRRGT
jgi:hypothetical protein